ncbi:uncharacterized protein LOC105843342 isoform X1 [Hydra vulgaris]|uniref:uncharacterized protein LOC105843342 isoform X1 n=1 Tax=Hydra vulgaris TaxID=6087 RepID=UPI001F5F5945|nr:uncharacterized protein LOC105843342 isoform X2 [Hydra vulgaris]
MPIEKIPKKYKFCILSHSHIKIIEQRKDKVKILQPHQQRKLRSSYIDKVNTLLEKLENAIDECQVFELESEVLSSLQMFKGTFNGSRPKLSLYIQFWNVLKKICQCKNFRILKESIVLLKDSFCSCPLTRQFITSLFDMGLMLLKLLIKFVDSELKLILVDACNMIFMRLYYHYLIGDLTEEFNLALNDLNLLNKDIYVLVKDYKDLNYKKYEDIDLLNLPNIISEIGQTDNSWKNNEPKKLNPFLLHCLHLWKIVSRKARLNLNDFLHFKEENLSSIAYDSKNWLHYALAFEILSECAIINLKCLKIYLQLGSKCGYFSSINKAKKLLNTLSVGNLFSKEKESLCFVKNGDLSVSTSPKYCDGIGIRWSHFTIAFYLKCLSKVCIAGITTDHQKLSLFGGKHYFGLIDYLDCDSDTRLQKNAYNLLKFIYLSVESNHVNEVLKNEIFQKLEEFKEYSTNDLMVMVPINQHLNRILFTNIATNLSIIQFVTNTSKAQPRTQAKPNIQITKRLENLSVKYISPVKQRTSIFIGPNLHTFVKRMAPELKNVVADQYIKELMQEDALREEYVLKKKTKQKSRRMHNI